MNEATLSDKTPDGPLDIGSRIPFWLIFGLTLLAIFGMWWPVLRDPLMRFDDFPAYFGDAELFWLKTLQEGRWINYLWHLRGLVTPAWLNFAIYQGLCALFAASVALLATGHGRGSWATLLLALVILASPPAMTFSLWFNSLLPGAALLALYATLAIRLSVPAIRALLPLFVVLTFWTYTTSPLLLLIICLLRVDDRSLVDLAKLLVLFGLSFVAAVLITYAINWQVHGVFDITPADWREATPAHDLAGLVANLSRLTETIGHMASNFSFKIAPMGAFHVALAGWAIFTLLRRAPMEALYLLAGLSVGFALAVVQVLKLGVIVPPRALMFAWVIYAIVAVRAAQLQAVASPALGRAVFIVIAMVPAFCLFVGWYLATFLRIWQVETLIIGQALTQAPAPIIVVGEPTETQMGVYADIQDDIALVFRLRQLTGREVIICKATDMSCDALSSNTTTLLGNDVWRIGVLPDQAGTLLEFFPPADTLD